MVHHIHGVIEERAGVLSILPQTTITIVGVLLHYDCIWVKTGEYLAGSLAFVDL